MRHGIDSLKNENEKSRKWKIEWIWHKEIKKKIKKESETRRVGQRYGGNVLNRTSIVSSFCQLRVVMSLANP